MEGLLLVRTAGDQGRACVVEPDEGGVERGGRLSPGVLLEPDDLLEHRQAAAAQLFRPGDPGPAAFGLPLLPGEDEFA